MTCSEGSNIKPRPTALHAGGKLQSNYIMWFYIVSLFKYYVSQYFNFLSVYMFNLEKHGCDKSNILIGCT